MKYTKKLTALDGTETVVELDFNDLSDNSVRSRYLYLGEETPTIRDTAGAFKALVAEVEHLLMLVSKRNELARNVLLLETEWDSWLRNEPKEATTSVGLFLQRHHEWEVERERLRHDLDEAKRLLKEW